jgi:putative glutamine amidotransferase
MSADEHRPVIGISATSAHVKWGTWDRPAVLLATSYITAIQRAGGFALMIPPDRELAERPDEALDVIDALIIAGGADIDPSAYGQERHPETSQSIRERDLTELALTRRAVERDMPVLGICRGMQVINVALGGTLHQHLPDLLGHEFHRRRLGTFEGNEHDVHLRSGSLAALAAGEEMHETRSHHHQGVATIGAGLEVTGHAVMDELPEAIEAPDRRFVLGVQWHPEADEESRVVGALVAQARRYRASRGSG